MRETKRQLNSIAALGTVLVPCQGLCQVYERGDPSIPEVRRSDARMIRVGTMKRANRTRSKW